MERLEIKIDNDDLRDIVYGDHEDWDEIESSVDGHWRHGTEHTGVFQRKSDGKYFRMDWRDSVKDECCWSDMNYGCVAKEVFPKAVTRIIYTDEPAQTAEISFDAVKDSDGWFGLCNDLGYDNSKCYEMFEYGEYGSFTIEVDKDFNIIGGIIHKSGK